MLYVMSRIRGSVTPYREPYLSYPPMFGHLGYFSAPSGIFRRRFVEVTTLLTLGPWTLVLIPKPHNTGSTHATTRHTQHCSLGPRAAPWKYTCKPEITVGGEAGSRPRHCGGRTISPSSSNMEGFLKRMR